MLDLNLGVCSRFTQGQIITLGKLANLKKSFNLQNHYQKPFPAYGCEFGTAISNPGTSISGKKFVNGWIV